MRTEAYVRLGQSALEVFDRQGAVLQAAARLGTLAEGTELEPQVAQLLVEMRTVQDTLGGIATRLTHLRLEEEAASAAASGE